MKRIGIPAFCLAASLVIAFTVAGLPTARGTDGHSSTAPSAFPGLVEAPLPDLESLVSYSHSVHLEDLSGPARQQVVRRLMSHQEAIQLRRALEEKGFFADPGRAEAMRVTIDGSAEESLGVALTIEVAVIPTTLGPRLYLPTIMRSGVVGLDSVIGSSEGDMTPLLLAAEQTSVAYLVLMVADDGSGFFQAHLTNLDPALAGVYAPPVMVNGMPYFYITTLQVVGGRVAHWRYWWYDSHNHPDWYYACYRHYWDYYAGSGHPWLRWYDWSYGWYYWRFWYYWSTYFPWAASVPGP